MAIEIERKYLVVNDDWRLNAVGVPYSQGYIAKANGRTVRVRIAGNRGWLTIKGPTVGLGRAEYEYEIPLDEAQELLETLCDRPLIEKTRYKIDYAGLLWEIDEFAGENQGLILAEVELTDANQTIWLPTWVGAEVSHDSRYYNSNLVKQPYRLWDK